MGVRTYGDIDMVTWTKYGHMRMVMWTNSDVDMQQYGDMRTVRYILYIPHIPSVTVPIKEDKALVC